MVVSIRSNVKLFAIQKICRQPAQEMLTMREERERAACQPIKQASKCRRYSLSKKALLNTVTPTLELLTRRHGHFFCELPLDRIPAPETLRLLVCPLLQRSFPLALCVEFVDVVVFDVAV